jgi:hypothetical protein
MGGVTGWKHHLDHKQSAIGIHRTTTVTEYGQALCLAPIVRNARERERINANCNVSASKAVDLYGEALFDRAGAF